MTREEAIDFLKAYYPDSCYKLLREAFDMAIEALKQPEQKRGEWRHLGVVEGYDIAGQRALAEKRECSECHFKTNFIEGHGLYAFCPNCGAKMEG